MVVADLATFLILGLLLRREGSGLRRLLGRVRPGRDALVGAGTGVVLLLAFLIASVVGNLVSYGGPPPPQAAADTPPLWFGIWSITVMPIKRLWPLIIGHWLIDVVGLGIPVLTATVSST